MQAHDNPLTDQIVAALGDGARTSKEIRAVLRAFTPPVRVKCAVISARLCHLELRRRVERCGMDGRSPIWRRR